LDLYPRSFFKCDAGKAPGIIKLLNGAIAKLPNGQMVKLSTFATAT
jgi:hypothetical protein